MHEYGEQVNAMYAAFGRMPPVTSGDELDELDELCTGEWVYVGRRSSLTT